MRKLIGPAILLIGIVAMLPGCSGSAEEGPQKISAPIDNSSPAAKNAPAAETGESPAELAGRMKGAGAGGGAASKVGIR